MSTSLINNNKKMKTTTNQTPLENEDDIMKYISSFDMKLSVVLLKIHLNTLIVKYNYPGELSPEFLKTLSMRIEKKYEENRSLITFEKTDDTLLEKININIFFQNENYNKFLDDQNYFKNFSRKHLKTLIGDLWNADILMQIMEDCAQSELEEIYKNENLPDLKEKASKMYVANLLNIHKVKDLENNLKHCKYIMQYQFEKIGDANAENRLFEIDLLKEKEKNARLTKLLEATVKNEPYPEEIGMDVVV